MPHLSRQSSNTITESNAKMSNVIFNRGRSRVSTAPVPLPSQVGEQVADGDNLWTERFKKIPWFSIGIFVLYISSGVAGYSYIFESWPILDSVYFGVITFTTVGYGDMGPESDGGKIFTIFFTFFGVAMISAIVGDLVANLSSIASSKKKDAIPELDVDADNNELTFKKFVMEQWIYIPAMIPLLFGAYLVVEDDSDSFVDVLYFFFITITTVGYGDVSPDRDIEKIWAILLVPIGVYAFATLIGNYIGFRVEQKAFEDSRKIMAEMNEDNLMQMDRDGSGTVTKLNYIEFMLVTMGKVDDDCLARLHAQFNTFDVDGNGALDKEDLVAALLKKETFDHSQSNELTSNDFDDPRTPLI